MPPRPASPRAPASASASAPFQAAATATPAANARAAWLPRALALLPALGFLIIVLAPPLNHDVAAVLDFSARMLAGERLYTGLVDVNPPLIFLLNLPAAWLAAHTPLDGPRALLLGLLLLCAGVLALCRALGHAEGARPAGAAERAVTGAALPLLLLAAGYDFGQREHIMAVAALPYLVLAERRIGGAATPWRLAAPAVLLAALGFALKPHFLAAPALVEAVVLGAGLARGRGAAVLRDPVPWAMAGLWALYLAAIPVFFPDYLGHVVPLVWQWYVGLDGAPWWRVLLTPVLGSGALFVLGLAALVPAAMRRAPLGWLPALLLAAAAGGLLAALVQHKGWSYHLVPVWLWGGWACALLLGRGADALLPAAPARRAAPLLAAGAAFALALLALRGDQSPWIQFRFAAGPPGQLTEWLEREAGDSRVLVLSPDIAPAYPAINYAGARSILPFMSLWLLQSTYQRCPESGARYRAAWEMSRAEFTVFRTVAERLARTPPAAVLVSRYTGMPACGGAPFDFIAYFRRHPLFESAWAQYRNWGEIDGYQLFVREE
ncbi:hypothetical protein CR162_12415 [Pseudoroseomonas rhizosphaerae]|uniref:Glycosyltransferase RgtA/B/C/D-like domain-containing protein n=1 Tax=Teichococcus rhizosphaerae TaxID=1335062 RepID=A0A2C7A9M5_9PROT|nr:hypothetical protein [Pseudoroseomonas rhizosphaerae]PHK94719.1 hypothetical protein CR162_12415 [Pseudoroseomonas rhizosphaerae]